MGRVKKGDHGAFTRLVERHIDALYGYAVRLADSPAVAEDLVQDTWLAAWQHARRYNRRKARVTTWLHRILHNKFIDTTRRKREELNELEVDAAVAASDTADAVDATRADAVLERLIGALPLNQRSAILLSHAQGFTNAEISRILGVSVRAVESLLARARSTLKTKLAQPRAAELSSEDAVNAAEERHAR